MTSRGSVYSNIALWADRTPENTPIIEVTWRDIQSVSNWDDDRDEVCPVRRFVSIGFLLYDGPDPKDPGQKMLVIATTYDADNDRWADYTAFPRPVIREIKTIVEIIEEEESEPERTP